MSNRLFAFPILLALAALVLGLPLHAEAAEGDDIVEVAVKAGSFKTLAAALDKAGLIKALQGKGPFTVFAPTDDAFAKLPKELIDKAMNDKALLTEILTYHVVPGRVLAADAAKLKSAETLQGEEIRIRAKKGVRINKAKVVKADIIASNGVIHVIDAVLLPPSKMKAIEKAAASCDQESKCDKAAKKYCGEDGECGKKPKAAGSCPISYMLRYSECPYYQARMQQEHSE